MTQEQLINIFLAKSPTGETVERHKNKHLSLCVMVVAHVTPFEELALNKGQTSSAANIVNSNGAMKTAVQQDLVAIGYVGIGHLNEQIKEVTFGRLLVPCKNG